MRISTVEHAAEAHPVAANGGRMFIGRCSAGDFEGSRRRTMDRAMSDAAEHAAEHTGETTYETTLILRVSARSTPEAMRGFRRSLIRMATRRGLLEQSLRETRPIATRIGQ